MQVLSQTPEQFVIPAFQTVCHSQLDCLVIPSLFVIPDPDRESIINIFNANDAKPQRKSFSFLVIPDPERSSIIIFLNAKTQSCKEKLILTILEFIIIFHFQFSIFNFSFYILHCKLYIDLSFPFIDPLYTLIKNKAEKKFLSIYLCRLISGLPTDFVFSFSYPLDSYYRYPINLPSSPELFLIS